MEYKRIYRCGILKITVFTNSRDILRLIENSLDLPTNHSSKPTIEVTFHIDVPEKRIPIWFDTITWGKRFDKTGRASLDYRDKISTVSVNPKTAEVNATIHYCIKELGTFIWYSVFMGPLQFILASRGFFYLHAAVAEKNNDCIIITGPSTCGKTTLALILAKKGYKILSDDDCFIKVSGKEILILPLSGKAGLNKYNLKRHPWLKKYILKQSRNAIKKRVALSEVFKHPRSTVLSPRRVMIVFPQFKKNAGLKLKPLPFEKALSKIDKGPRCPYSNKEYQETFWRLYSFVKKCASFEVTHNDRTVFKAADLISAHFNTPQP